MLFSLGSLVTFDNTPEHILRAMIDAFGQFGKESKCQVVAKIPLVELAKFYAIDYAENVLKIREIANPDLFKLDPEEDLFSNMHSISDDQRTKFPNNVYPISWVRQQEFIGKFFRVILAKNLFLTIRRNHSNVIEYIIIFHFNRLYGLNL